jgi:hypothetical protein
MVERADLLKSKFFSLVAYLKTDLAEFNHSLDQRYQARCYFRFPQLITNLQWKKMFARPSGENVHINKKPLSGSTFLGPPKSGVLVFLAVVAM